MLSRIIEIRLRRITRKEKREIKGIIKKRQNKKEKNKKDNKRANRKNKRNAIRTTNNNKCNHKKDNKKGKKRAVGRYWVISGISERLLNGEGERNVKKKLRSSGSAFNFFSVANLRSRERGTAGDFLLW